MRAGERTAVYRFYDAKDRALYVGMTRDYVRRCKEHFFGALWFSCVVRTVVVFYPSRFQAMMAERAAIQTESPVFNEAKW